MQRLSYLICSALLLLNMVSGQATEHCRIKHQSGAASPAASPAQQPPAAQPAAAQPPAQQPPAAQPAAQPAAAQPPAQQPAAAQPAAAQPPAQQPPAAQPAAQPAPPSQSGQISGGPGYCYEPYHDDGFPMSGKGNPNNILGIIERDFKVFQQENVKVLHTYMSTYFSKDYISIAAKYGIQLYVGIQLFDDPKLFGEQVQAAVNGYKSHPDTILGFIIGNENLQGNGGKYSADSLMGKMDSIRGQFKSQGVKVPPIGTAQRINEWLSNAPGMNALAANVDFIGVNIYPFYTPGWNPAQPTALLDAQFNQMKQRYPQFISKFVITESGWPTGGSAPPGFPNNIPNVANAKAYYEGYMKWNPNVRHFWFLSHDRRLDDPAAKPLFEAYFGRYTKDGQKKY